MKAKRQYRGGYQRPGSLELARRRRNAQTSAEDLLWQRIRNRQINGFKFRREHQFGNYICDFFCREANLVVECDGEVHDQNESWHHDQARDAYMISQGLRILRFTNQQILHDTESVLREIQDYLPAPSGSGAEVYGAESRAKPSPQPSPRGRGR